MGEFPRSAAWLRERLSFSEAQLAETREMLEILPENLDLVLEIYGPDGACAALRLGEERAVVRRFLACAAGAGHGIFGLMSAPPGEPLSITFDGQPVVLISEMELPGASVVNWTRSVFLAIALRDEAALSCLLRVDVAGTAAEGILIDDCRLTWARCLQAFLLGREWSSMLERCRNQAKEAPLAGAEYVAQVDAPLFDVLQALGGGDTAALRAAATRSLAEHREHWRSAERRDLLGGELALGPLAFLCLAHDRGIRVDIEDECVPRWLVEGG